MQRVPGFLAIYPLLKNGRTKAVKTKKYMRGETN